ncbi:UNVERIFIED_ORG: hypothetical protein GGI57_006412 [Rhizobium aethiopicum]|uniref:Virulence VirF1 protein n=2 Tax=Rhizobium TaxID=379 RepID=Q2K2D3_RHIEC|nr:MULTISPECIES: hypothetical protein [Rhizobium]UWU39019.1 virulence protein [Rhizobium leguminosarum bv. phaseoli]ABC92909.1 virulence VirF1 protein [Rhizobium etli CFN 42]MBB4420730.1 hypothetical protein [Rhizobium leguminosarum]MDK4730414.1 virulence protein [Rhizobium phaseoli]NKE92098.1 virulence protein [Rhizobium phaseoli]
MDSSTLQGGGSGTVAAHDARETQLLDLPDSLLTEVAKRLTTENPVETAENVANFNETHALTSLSTRTEPFETFKSRLKILSYHAKLLPHTVRHAPTLPDGERLTENQLARMQSEVAYRPVLGTAYTHHAGQAPERLAGTDLARRIEGISDEVFDVAEPVMFREISAHELMPKIRPIAKSIKEAHDGARAELMSADRQREGRGR